jgi:hypothetical protein
LIFPPDPTMTGINNRAANAASVGVAVSLVGAVGWLAYSLQRRHRWAQRVFASGIATICVAGFLTIDTVARFWTESYQAQVAVLAAIRERFTSMPTGTSLILDGVCPYHGPAIVFDSTWDLRGALVVMYGHPGILADVAARSNASVTERGLSVRYGGGANVYPFRNLVLYDFSRRTAHELGDAEAAGSYINSERRAARECQVARHGFGVPILQTSLRSGLAHLLGAARRTAPD